MKLHKLHPTQKRLLSILLKYSGEELSIRELCDRLTISSTSVVHHHIIQLEKKGYLRRNPANPQDYQILGENPDKRITYLNLYGMAECGPNGSLLDGNPVDRIAVESKILGFSSANAFLVKARGKSMEPKIHENDLVIVEKTDAICNGDLVVCVNKGDVLIKKFTKADKNIILVSLNEEFKPFVTDEDFHIEGKVRGILSYL